MMSIWKYSVLTTVVDEHGHGLAGFGNPDRVGQQIRNGPRQLHHVDIGSPDDIMIWAGFAITIACEHDLDSTVASENFEWLEPTPQAAWLNGQALEPAA